MTDAVLLVANNPGIFPERFARYLPANLHVYDLFEHNAILVINRGYKHYSARTIVEFMRHHTAIADNGSVWKLNNLHIPYLARLFALRYPQHATLFDFRNRTTT